MVVNRVGLLTKVVWCCSVIAEWFQSWCNVVARWMQHRCSMVPMLMQHGFSVNAVGFQCRYSVDTLWFQCCAGWPQCYSSPPGQNGHHFANNIFKCIFVNEKVCILIKISLNFVPKGPIDNNPALVYTMAWCWIGNKPLSKPTLTRFIDAYMQH